MRRDQKPWFLIVPLPCLARGFMGVMRDGYERGLAAAGTFRQARGLRTGLNAGSETTHAA